MVKQSVVREVLLTLTLLCLVTLLKLMLLRHGSFNTSVLSYTLVVVISVWRSGWKFGVFTSLLSVLIINYFFLEPYNLIVFPWGNAAHSLLFLAETFTLSYLGFALKKANAKSSRVEKKYRILLEQACDVVTLRDKDGKALYVSPKVESVLGYTAEEYAAMNFEQVVHPEDLTHFVSGMREVGIAHKPQKVVCARFKHKNGEYRWIESIFDYLDDEDICAVVSHFKDVTDRVMLERQKDDFIGIASHELRTPLTSVKALIQIAQKKGNISFLDKAKSHVVRLEKLISDLLDVSKINSGKLNYTIAEHNFREVLEESIETVRHYSSSHQIIVKNSPDVLFQGDRYRIEQVITNFLSNAGKYSPGADTIEVDVEVVQANIIFSVRDFGIGIAPDQLTKLFDRFYRVENNAMKFEGLGLGLFIASEIIKRHHGSFWIESELGKGSTFYLKIPVAGKPDIGGVETDNETFYSDSTFRIRFNDEKSRIDGDYIGYQNVESVEKGCRLILEYTQRHSCSKLLNDNTELLGNWSEAADKVGNVWIPKMEAVGLRQAAWIYSPNTFAKLAAEKSVDITAGNLNIKFFDSKAKGAEWLESDDA